MAKEFLGVGWKFLVQATPSGGIALSEHEADIKEAIWIILSTAKGERVMRPDFGCGIHDLVFAPINVATLPSLRTASARPLTIYVPRIELIGVKASPERADVGKLIVSIDYRVRSTNNRFNLVYPFYLKEGSL